MATTKKTFALTAFGCDPRNKLNGIKALRAITGLGLADAKHAFESLASGPKLLPVVPPELSPVQSAFYEEHMQNAGAIFTITDTQVDVEAALVPLIEAAVGYKQFALAEDLLNLLNRHKGA